MDARSRPGRSKTVLLDATREPKLYFGFHPANRAQPDPQPARESALGLKLVDHRAPEASDFADLRQTKNLDGGYRPLKLRSHKYILVRWLKGSLGDLSYAAILRVADEKPRGQERR